MQASVVLETPEKTFLHFPWIEDMAHRSLGIDDGPSGGRVARTKKICTCIFVDDIAKEGSKEEDS